MFKIKINGFDTDILNKRVPVGVSIEKLESKEYEVKLYYTPDIDLDGIEYAQCDKVFLRVFKTKIFLKAYLYALHVKHMYKLNYKNKYHKEGS